MSSIFSESQLWSLALSLEKWDCPLKFSYMTPKWAQAWNEIEIQRAKNNGNYAEYELLRDNINVYLQDIGNPQEVCFFDFGCGTGKTVKDMLERLCKSGLKVHYHAFDISANIIELAKETIWDLWKNYSFNYTTLDFETNNLTNILFETRKLYHDVPVIGMLLGNTLGNFDSMERIVLNIVEAFRIKDRLVVGIEKFDISSDRRLNEMINSYKQDIIFGHEFATLEHFWIRLHQWREDIIFNTKSNAIEGFFEFTEDAGCSIGKHHIKFQALDRVRLFKSAKLNEAQFAELFLNLDLRIGAMRTNLRNTYTEILLWSKKY